MTSPITTINNEPPPRDQFTANGIQTTFSVGWPARRPEDVLVEFNAGVAPSIGYTFSPANLNEDTGFDVIFNSPPPDGTIITVYRRGKLERQSNYGQQKQFTAATVNAEFADYMLRLQELKRDLSRTVRLPISDPAAQLILPDKATRSGKYATYDGSGNLSVAGDVYGGSGTGTTEELHGLIDDGVTDQAADIETLLNDAIVPLRIVGNVDGTSAIKLGRRVMLEQMPDFDADRVTFIFDASAGAGFYIRGQEIELPAVGKAKLFANVDATGGAVTAFDIDVSANASIVPLLTAGADIVIRGQNGADGDVLDEHKHEAEVVSLVLVSGTRYTLTITPGLPSTIPGGIWKTVWPGSAHPAPDETLISVVASAKATADLTDSRTMTIAAGAAAALGLVAGQWVEVTDDAVGADTHGTSQELLHSQVVRVAKVEAGTPDAITFDDPILGALTTAKRARLVMLTPVQPFRMRGPGPAFPVRVVGIPPAYPASRRHIIEAKYAIDPEITGWHYNYDAADGYTRGAILRTSNCYRPLVHSNWIEMPGPDFAGVDQGGDHYGIWSKGDTGGVIECNFVRGGRHCIVAANAKNAEVRANDVGGAAYQNLDLHGENETGVKLIGNRITAGAKWASRTRRVAIQAGNQTHTGGAHKVLIEDNEIVGFTEAADVGVLVVSGSADVLVDQDFIHPIGEAVRVDADNRAPDVLIERVTFRGSTPQATTGVALDGRMQVWENGGSVSGSASRPVYIDDATGTRRYVTEDTGTLGGTNPTHTSGTVTDGDVDLEYVGLISAQTVPIDGVRILADLSRAGTEVSVYRAANVTYGVEIGSYLQRGDVFPEPGLVESVAGAFVLDWETDFDGPRIVKLVRAAGDVSESLLVTLPEIPSGDWATVLIPEPMVFQAPTRTFSIATSWTDVLGVGTITITESGVTTATLALAVGDVVLGGPFGSPTTIATIESSSAFTTADPCGETDSGTISIVAPAYSIDGARLFESPPAGDTGIFCWFAVMAPSTPTTRGEIKTLERSATSGDLAWDLGDGDLEVVSGVARVQLEGTATADVTVTFANGNSVGQIREIVTAGDLDIYTVTIENAAAAILVASLLADKFLRFRWSGTAWGLIGAGSRTEQTGGSSGGGETLKWIDARAAAGNVTDFTEALISAHTEPTGYELDQSFTIANDVPVTGAFKVWNRSTSAIAATIEAGVGGTGTFTSGGSSYTIPAGGRVTFVVRPYADDEPSIYVEGDATTVGYGGRQVSGNLGAVLSRGAGSSQPTAADSGAWITTDGAITIPASVGWNCTLEFGGDHDATFAGDVWDTGASAGDIVSVFVKSATVIRITPMIAAADVITEADFA